MKKFSPHPPALFLIYICITQAHIIHLYFHVLSVWLLLLASPNSFIYFLWLCQQISQFLDSQGFLDYLERGLGSEENNNNLLDKLQDAIGRGQNPLSVLPSLIAEPEIVTISDPGVGISGTFSY